MKRYLWPILILALLAVLCTAAMAKEGGKGERGSGGQGGPGEREGRGGPPVLFGEITALSKSSLTLKPEIPEKMRERMEERGGDMPKLPKSIELKLGPDTKWYFDDTEGSRQDFAVGDKVVVKLLRGNDKAKPTAEVVADPETAREYIMEKMRERRGERGEDGGAEGKRGDGEGRKGKGDGARGKRGAERGDWRGGDEAGGGWGGPGEGFGPGDGGPGMGPDGEGFGPGGPGMDPDGEGFGPGGEGKGRGRGMGPGGRGGNRPAFGTVSKIGADSITITPQIPDFIKDKLQQNDIALPELPDTLTIPLDEFTMYVDGGEKLTKNPFAKGDKVVIIMCRMGDEPCARAVVDLKTAQAKLEALLDGRGGKGRGQDGAKAGKKEGGKGKAKAGRKAQNQSDDSGEKRRNPR